eukprot:g5954.t1
MASLTTNEPPAKRQRTTNESTLEALQQERAPPPIEIGILLLPAGFESACGIMTKIFLYLDIRSLCNVKRSSLIQQLRKAFGCDDFERVRDEALSLSYEGRRSINEDDMTLKDMVSEADPNIANSGGSNALHFAANFNRTNTELIELLLTNMPLNSINKKTRSGYTPLDWAYFNNHSPIRQEIIALLRSKGGKANCFDENGRDVGRGNGDLNH